MQIHGTTIITFAFGASNARAKKKMVNKVKYSEITASYSTRKCMAVDFGSTSYKINLQYLKGWAEMPIG